MADPQIVWFRQDLRVNDQAALAAAAAAGPVACVYVLDDDTPGDWSVGGAQRWWLHHALTALDAELRARGGRLMLLRGRAGPAVATLAERIGAGAIHATRHHEPFAKLQEAEAGERLVLHGGQTLVPPGAVRTGQGGRFKVFSPFWRALQDRMPPDAPQPAPERLTQAEGVPDGDGLAGWGLLPTRPNWAAEFPQHWTPGEAGGRAALQRFAAMVHGYAEGRNLPGEARTSALSPHLHMGEISAAAVWHAATEAAGDAAEPFLREIGWRDFAIQALDAEPDSPDRPIKPAFARFPFRDEPAELDAWRRGRTGYPIVDAGMRQLWRTGWMHNRVRMIASSFCVKHLLIDWRVGERWFWDCLVDADLANNTLGWQWIMGSGYDAQPFFRIFEPVAQGRRHDPRGAYVRRWVPELAGLPDEVIHAPWEASAGELARADVRLGDTYPERIVDHAFARRRALDAYAAIKDG